MNIPKNAFLLNCDLFHSEVILLTDQKQIDWMNENYPKNNFFLEGAKGSYFNGSYNEEEVIIMVVLDDDKTTLVHECVHCCHSIMHNVGIPINYENTEVQAYITHSLFEQAFDLMFSSKRVKKGK